MAAAKKVNKLTTFAFAQQLKPEYWPGLTDDEKRVIEAAAKGVDVQNLGTMLLDRFKSAGLQVTDFYYCVHNRDTRLVWSDAAGAEVVEAKDIHVHGVVKCDAKGGDTPGGVATAAGLAPQYIEKPKKGRYAYDNMLAYLVHAKYPDKFQYAASDVFTVLGRSYADIYAERFPAWLKARGAVTKQKAADDIDDLEYKILTGQVTKSQVVLTDQLFEIYARNVRRCDDAFRVYGTRKAYKAMQALQNGEFRLSVIFVTGKPRSGKSRIAEAMVKGLCERNKNEDGLPWAVYRTAATNPLDDYAGEEIIYMDDVRGSAMLAEDWLKLLDPYHVSPGSARYHNVTPACRVVIITSYKDPVEFFYYVKTGGGNRSEALDQFIGRIQSMVHVIREDDWEAPLYALSEGKKHDAPALATVGSDVDKEGNPIEVTLEYGFGNKGIYDAEGIVEQVVEIVRENNKAGCESGGKGEAEAEAADALTVEEQRELELLEHLAADGSAGERDLERMQELRERQGVVTPPPATAAV